MMAGLSLWQNPREKSTRREIGFGGENSPKGRRIEPPRFGKSPRPGSPFGRGEGEIVGGSTGEGRFPEARGRRRLSANVRLNDPALAFVLKVVRYFECPLSSEITFDHAEGKIDPCGQ